MKALENPKTATQSEVVVTGYGVRLPQAENIADFWQVLTDQKCIISEIGNDRFSKEMFYHPDPAAKGKTYSVAAGQLDNIWKFDPGHFGISHREAEQMDPQQRLLLEVTSEALTEAGLTQDNWDRDRTGVYVGASSSDYSTGFAGDPDAIDAQFMVGNTLSIISNRLSYVFDIKGPSFTIDTACSSSFYAMDQAVEALRLGKIDTAIVGAVNLLISPIPFIGFSRASMLSRDGLCKAFDADANGYVRSEGAVVFILRRLDVAKKSRDKLRVVIHASGVNSDGRTVGLSMPSSQRQQELLCDIRAQNPFDLNDLAFVEAHGTGTAVGDPIEANAIGNAFAKTRGSALPIGSAKTNFGHLEPASGLVGMLKSVLALEKGIYPASLHIKNPNPHIDFDRLNIALNTKPLVLPERNRPWLAGINSFGFGGANAHVILRQLWDHEQTQLPDIAPRNQNLVLCAGSEQGLRDLANNYVGKILDDPSAAFRINNTNYRREKQDHRLVALGGNTAQIKTALMAFLANTLDDNLIVGKNNIRSGDVGFVFSGNGAQWPGMGRHLYATNPQFRISFDQVSDLFKEKSNEDLAMLLFSQEFEQQLGRSALVQPLAFAIQVALCDSLAKAGLRPSAVVGHSAGEVSAAYVAGILSLESAVNLVHSRSTALATLYGQGGMAAVLAGAGPLRDALADFGDSEIVMSAENSTRSTSISGPIDSLKQFSKFAKTRRVAVKLLDIPYPFHSPAVDSIKEVLLNDLADLQPAQGDCAYYSSTLGEKADGLAMTAQYWWANTRNPVLFRASVAAMVKDGCDIVVEISPKSILRNYVMDSIAEGRKIGYVSTLGAGKDAEIGIDAIVAKSFVNGANIEKERFLGPEAAYFANLPGLPWQHQNFRAKTSDSQLDIYGRLGSKILLGQRVHAAEGAWRTRLDTTKMPWLADHKVDKSTVLPATAFIDIALSAGRAEFNTALLEISDLELLRPVVFDQGIAVDIRTRFEKSAHKLSIDTRKANCGADWELACFCTLRVNPHAEIAPWASLDGPAVPDLYADLAEAGLAYGPEFALATHVVLAKNAAQVDISSPRAEYDFTLDPRTADAALHSLFSLVKQASETDLPKGVLMVPAAIGSVQLFKEGARICRANLVLKSLNLRGLVADVQLCDHGGTVCAQFTDIRLRALQVGQSEPEIPTWYQQQTRLSSADIVPDIVKIAEKLTLFRETKTLNDAAILIDTTVRAIVQREMLAFATNHIVDLSELKNPALGQFCLETLAQDGLARENDNGKWQIDSEQVYPEIDVLLAALMNKAPLCAVELQDLLKLGQQLGPCLISDIKQDNTSFETTNFRQAARQKWQLLDQILTGVLQAWQTEKRLKILVIGQIPRCVFNCISTDKKVDQLVISDLNDSNIARQKQYLSAPKADFILMSELAKNSDFDLVISADGLWHIDPAQLRIVANSMADNGQMLIISEQKNILTMLSHAKYSDFWDEKSMELGYFVPRHVIGGNLVQKLAQIGFSDVQVNPLWTEEAEISLITCQRLVGNFAQMPENINWLVLTDHAAGEDIAARNVVYNVESNAKSGEIANILERCKDICQRGPARLAIVQTQENMALTGVGRVLINEFPGVKTQVLTVDDPNKIDHALQLLTRHKSEPTLTWRKGAIFAPRIQRGQNILPNPQRGTGQRLDFSQAGQFQSLGWHPMQRRDPKPHEVEIEVKATGLNFRDVMWAQGMLPAEALENGFSGAGLGMECVGVVVKTGANTPFKIGDFVLGFAPFAFSTHVTVDAQVLGKVPKSMPIEAAAALPVAFLTALYGLEHMAQLQQGETVLIHGGAGGVGMAALQIAKNLGATVIATAGSVEKRQLLRDLGAKWVLDSRSLRFAEEINRLTGGVDVVLNSLAGEAMERSINCLKPFGRFVELGKRDFFANSRIGLRPFRKNLSYFGVDVDQLLVAKPEMVSRLFKKLQAGFENGAYLPPPCQVFNADEAGDAFRLMQKSGHIGKIIIRAPETNVQNNAAFKARGAWLIIGGTGGVGLATAKYLAKAGAEKLWLVSRSGEADISEIDAQVEFVACDASDPAQMAQLFARIAADDISLRGVIHGAMVLDDALLIDQTAERMLPVLHSKIAVGDLLDLHCKNIPLDHFVMFSSISTVFGNPGQAAYVAGNAYLEGLVKQRRQNGEPGNCIAFGPICDVGYLADKPEQKAFMQNQMGGRILNIDVALHALGDILVRNPDETIAIGPMAWGNMATDLALLKTRYFDRIDLEVSAVMDRGSVGLLALVDGLNATDALAKAVELLRAEAAKVLMQPPDDIDADKPLTDLGFDSLMAMSLRMQAEENLGINLPLMALVDGLTLNQLAYKVLNDTGEIDNLETELIAQHVDADGIDPEIVKNVAFAAQNISSLSRKKSL